MSTVKKKTCVPSIDPEQCKGCQRCVNACPKKCLRMSQDLNVMGYPYAVYTGDGCIGCGACFYNCPEPGAVTIYEEESEDGE